MRKASKRSGTVSLAVELPLDLEESHPDAARRLQLQLAAGEIAQGNAVRATLREPVVEALGALTAALWRHELRNASLVESTRAAAQAADALLQRGAASMKAAVLDAIETCGLDGRDARTCERVRVALLRIQKDRAEWRSRKGMTQSVQKASRKRTRTS